MSETTYQCPICHREIKVGEGLPVPVCCGREMEPLPFCMAMPDPEQARNDREEGPCDDATSSPDRGRNRP